MQLIFLASLILFQKSSHIKAYFVNYRRLTEFGQGFTEFGPPMWQAEADTELTLSASPATAVGPILLTMAKFC